MRDESIAATNIEDLCAAWNNARYLQSHVVSAADFAAATFACPATLQTMNKSIAFSRFRD